MLAMLRELVAHKGHANASLLSVVVRSHDVASDGDVLDLLHHILVANRFWSCKIRGVPFVPESEMTTLKSCDALLEAFRRTQEEEESWLSTATDTDCAVVLEDPLIPGGRCSVAQAFVQVCMHSHGHRAQLAKLLRRYDVAAPQTDFILWLTSRATANWSTGTGGHTAG
jgi:uncharacterized damage-inducible protein DinB